jgi:ectoine hydroxylase-related dioxygenase (phytanoyl-CoA dioxygenase family)
VALATVGSDVSAAALVEILEQQGAVIIEGLATPETMDRVAEELAPWLELPIEESPLGNDRFKGMKTLRTSSLMAKSAACRELVMTPRILEVLDLVLGPQCAAYQLTWTQAIRIAPGEVAQVPHRDTNMYPFARPGPECFVNSIWALTDFTEANGATVVYPASHTWDDARSPAASDEVTCAAMKRGSVVVYYGSAYHGGGANQTDTDRIGVGFAYTLGWLRQEENQYLACPSELARTFSPALQELMGYAGHFPFVGWHEGMDPARFTGASQRKRYTTALRGRGEGRAR